MSIDDAGADDALVRARCNRAVAIAKRTAVLSATTIPRERVRALNATSVNDRDGAYAVYWMQASHRVEHNEALEFAIHRANVAQKPLIVMFSCTASYPEASERHYGFMFEGLVEVYEALRRRRISMTATINEPPASIVAASRRATEIIVDGAYMRILRAWRAELARESSCAVTEIEADVVVPQLTNALGGAAEIAAATFRPKVLPRVPAFVKSELPQFPYAYGELDDDTRDVFEDAIKDFETLPVDQGVDACLRALSARGLPRLERCPRVTSHIGGARAARDKLDTFLTTKILSRYAQSRNDPSMGLQSHLSPHIQYGQISVVEIARRALGFQKAHAMDAKINASVDVFLDELIVRRELAVNFALRNPHYDTYEGLPEWSRNTLARHASDARAWTYTLEQFERGETHDKLWNAAQRELVVSGKQHNFVRMYWGKKILEWTAVPEDAWRIAMTLNNRYSLDGRNMVSLTGVGWCFGLHDREFYDVEVTGTTRRFSAEGMSKKFPAGMKAYLERWGDGGHRKRQARIADMFASVKKVRDKG